MSETPTESTQFPQFREEWKGRESLPRVLYYIGMGMKKGAIARIFGVNRRTITNSLKLLKEATHGGKDRE